MRALLVFCILAGQLANSQNLAFDFTNPWSQAGLIDTLDYDTLHASDYGFVGDSITANDTAWFNLLPALGSNPTLVLFSPGTYLFTTSLSIPGQTLISGAGSDSTHLVFSVEAPTDLMRISGSIDPTKFYLTQNALKGQNIIYASGNTLALGDWLYIDDVDTALAFSSWSDGYCGQLAKVVQIWPDSLEINRPLRRNYTVIQGSFVQKMLPLLNSGISCLSIQNSLSSPVPLRCNISIQYAFNCFVKGVESINCDFSHLSTERSGFSEVSGCYFHHATSYGGGGQGYGINLQLGACDWLIKNNNIDHCRHSMLLQGGSNGNVFYHNYSTDPYWTEFPNTAAGDLVLHGNYPYMNLFEENVIQNLSIDASHGKNGPYNIFLRNRVQLFGLITSNNPASDSCAFIGNEITNTGQFLGNFLLNGNGHFNFGNNHRGNTVPAGTSALELISLYDPSQVGPIIGYPNPVNSETIEPVINRASGIYTLCGDQSNIPISNENTATSNLFVVNPVINFLEIHSNQEILAIRLVNSLGGIVMEQAVKQTKTSRINISALSAGLYWLEIKTQSERINRKVLVGEN